MGQKLPAGPPHAIETAVRSLGTGNFALTSRWENLSAGSRAPDRHRGRQLREDEEEESICPRAGQAIRSPNPRLACGCRKAQTGTGKAQEQSVSAAIRQCFRPCRQLSPAIRVAEGRRPAAGRATAGPDCCANGARRTGFAAAAGAAAGLVGEPGFTTRRHSGHFECSDLAAREHSRHHARLMGDHCLDCGPSRASGESSPGRARRDRAAPEWKVPESGPVRPLDPSGQSGDCQWQSLPAHFPPG